MRACSYATPHRRQYPLSGLCDEPGPYILIWMAIYHIKWGLPFNCISPAPTHAHAHTPTPTSAHVLLLASLSPADGQLGYYYSIYL